MARKPTTLDAYVKSIQDKREDAANAKIVGMTVGSFKKTPQAKAIDRQIVSLNRAQAKRGK